MRRELSRRPGLLVCLALAGGLTAWDGPVGIALALASVALGLGAGWRLGITAAFLVGLGLAPAAAPRLSGTRPFRGEAVVTSIPRLSRTRQACEIESGGAFFTLNAPASPTLATGDALELVGQARGLSTGVGRLGAMRRISGTIWVEAEGLKVRRYGAAPFRMGVEWRRSFAAFVDGAIGREAAAATKALCFNVDADLSESTYGNLQRTGTVHIISASGLHVLIFAAGLSFVLAALPIPRGWKLAIVGAVLAIYAIGAGMRPPVVRSVLMAAVLGFATLVRREPDLLSALGVSATAYLLWRPVAVFDVGFQLSFAAVAGLAMFLGLPNEMPTGAVRLLGRQIGEIAKASLVATLATAPLTAYYFGMVSLISVPANILITLVLAPITLTAFFAHLVASLLPGLSQGLMGGLVEPLTGWVLGVVNGMGPLPNAAIGIPNFSAYWMLPYYGAMLLLWRPHVRPV